MISTTNRVANALEQHKDEIVSLWLARVRNATPEARAHPDNVVIDSLPEFIDEIALLMSRGEDPAEKGADHLQDICAQHGRQRAALAGYTLEKVLSDFFILRRTLLEVLEREGPLVGVERNIVINAVYFGNRGATIAYVNRYIDDERHARNEAEMALAALRTEREMREEFVAAISHDLRSPLTAAKANAQMALRYGDDPEHRAKLLRTVVDSMNRADRMIRDLLDSSAIRQGRQIALQLHQCNLEYVAADLVASLNPVYGGRLVLRTAGNCDGLWDADNLRRAIENLVVNAAKYGDPHAPIEIAVEGNSQVYVSVHNRGNPISENMLGVMFEPFVHMTSGAQRNSGSWGLGLPIVKGIAEAHHGSVSVVSNAEAGTTFTITLPRDSRGDEAT